MVYVGNIPIRYWIPSTSYIDCCDKEHAEFKIECIGCSISIIIITPLWHRDSKVNKFTSQKVYIVIFCNLQQYKKEYHENEEKERNRNQNRIVGI